ncbi:MAG: HAD-IIA family hydrolase [Burkholderiaceae bacterium]
MDAAFACDRYRQIRDRLPASNRRPTPRAADSLAELAGEFDCFVLDGFGVLNVGDQPIAGVAGRLAQLRAMGRQLLVLTNGASFPTENTVDKYRRWGMAFERADVVSSRDALAQGLASYPAQMRWGFMAPANGSIDGLTRHGTVLADEARAYDQAEGFVLLGSGEWTERRQALLAAALGRRPRPVLVGNPDLTAPREHDFSYEPGFFAHALADAGVAEPVFYGKPFGNAFARIRERLPAGLAPERVAMVGDTLHTDILGGQAAGFRSVLVTAHGLMKTLDIDAQCARSDIWPDFIIGSP